MNLTRTDWDHYRSALEDLFLQSFGKPAPTGYLDWRYRDNNQEALFFEVEMAEGCPVASYSMFPVELGCGDTIFSSAMSMTTMTHPKWRGQGLFPKLASALYSHAAKTGASLVWGFPNANSHLPFNTKLGWKDIYEIPALTLDLKDGNRKQLWHFDVKRDDGFELHYPPAPDDGLIRIRRTPRYLRWRYTRNPANRYSNFVISKAGEVSSYLIVKQYGQELDLVDLQAKTPEEAMALITHVEMVSGATSSRMNCWAPTHHFIHGVLERLGFKNSLPVTYFAGRQLDLRANLPDWTNYRNWYIQMGDSDVY